MITCLKNYREKLAKLVCKRLKRFVERKLKNSAYVRVIRAYTKESHIQKMF
jgi:hypothetical protein